MVEMITLEKIGGISRSRTGFTVPFSDPSIQKQFDNMQKEFNSKVESAVA